MATPKYVRRWESLIAALEQLDTDDLSNAAIQRVEELHEAHRNAPASSACLHKLALNTQVSGAGSAPTPAPCQMWGLPEPASPAALDIFPERKLVNQSKQGKSTPCWTR